MPLFESYHTALKQYEQLLASKQKAFHDKKLELKEISHTSNSQPFWEIIKSMNDDISEKTIPPISEDQWLHFESLHSVRSNNEKQDKLANDLIPMEQNECNHTPLNESIIEKEIQDTKYVVSNNFALFLSHPCLLQMSIKKLRLSRQRE